MAPMQVGHWAYRTPELFDAARTSLIHRGDPSTGWSMGWKVCLWARLHGRNSGNADAELRRLYLSASRPTLSLERRFGESKQWSQRMARSEMKRFPKPYINEVTKNVVASISTTNKGHISTGVIGAQWLLRELSRRGHADVAYLLATNKTYPSWGYMAAQGATTIWELWNGDKANPEMNSGNHVMLLSDLLPWCFNNLAGIHADRWKTGYKRILLQPEFDIKELSKVDASYMSIYGKVVSHWTKTPTHLEWDIELPANTTGEACLPDGRKEKIGSGKYHFSELFTLFNRAS